MATLTHERPLPKVATRRRKQLARKVEELPQSFQAWLHDNGYAFEEHLETREGRSALSLALDLVRDGALEGRTARVLIVETAIEGEHASRGSIALANSLRIAARLIRDGILDEAQAAEWETMADTQQWARPLVDAVRGLPENREDLRLVATEEELAAEAAVVAFVLTARGDKLRADGKIRNPLLLDLLRERPADLRRIIAYVQAHGIHPTRKRDVRELRDWLDNGTTAFLGGLL